MPLDDTVETAVGEEDQVMVSPEIGAPLISFGTALTWVSSPTLIVGELMVIVQNGGGEPVRIARGERIAQLVFALFETPRLAESEALAESERGAGGFGSTGR